MDIKEKEAPKELEKKVEEIFMALTNRRFARYRPKDEFRIMIIKKIQSAVEAQSPLVLVIGFGYHKNPNAASNLLPDMAEEQTIQRLFELTVKVREVYQHGMKIKIITSGRRAEIVNGVNSHNTFQYHRALSELISKKVWQEEIGIIPINDLYAERLEELEAALRKKETEVSAEIADCLNVDFWNHQIEYARRNINRNGLSHDEAEKKAREAAAKYVIFRRAESEINLLGKKFPGSIIASYNNDSATSLKLWTLRKGCITQPWQGIAEIVDGRCEVITQTRKKE
jgi:pyoverdine/dityrosine biosynthesis protein Dit1